MQLREFSDSQRPIGREDAFDCHKPDDDPVVCDCCTESLAKLIRRELRRGDPIGITYVENGVATIFVGIFLDLVGSVVVVRDLFLDDLISFVSLCGVSSVEIGCALSDSDNSPLRITPA